MVDVLKQALIYLDLLFPSAKKILQFVLQDEDSPPSNQNKGKLNQIGSKSERDEVEDESESRHESGSGGKGMSYDCGKLKQEIKTEPMDHESSKGSYSVHYYKLTFLVS